MPAAGVDAALCLGLPDPRLFPLQQLNRSLAQVSKTATAMSVIENLPPGNAELRHAIARRYALQDERLAGRDRHHRRGAGGA